MGKLQYDSFYKFMVSAGVVLVAAPLIGLYYLLCNGNQILLSQSEYDELSYSSMQFIQQRDQTILYVLRVLPWLLVCLIVLGLGCLIYGGIKWHSIQKEIDEQTKLKTREQQINVEKLSATEIAEKAIDEAADEHENQPSIDSNVSLEKSRVVKALEIENLCYSFVFKQHSRSYNIQQNIRVDNYACDILAVSQIDRIDYLFEIKYWTSFPSAALLNRVVKRMEDLRLAYETKSQRLSKSILMIVTLDENKSSLQERLDHYASKHSMSFDFRIYTENELK
ncbi:MAG: hypothetical protein Q4E38_00570 [Eubacteriales bacterium]|nr:hypothetical protein [Eubacteriales bacterium]